MSPTKRMEFGALAEKYALEFLKSRNYWIIAQNYKKPWGELDLVVEKDGVLVFVEVKANHKEMPGFEPELRVNRDKLKRIIRAAKTFLTEKNYNHDQEWQIDIVSITLDKDKGVAKIRHFKNIEV